MKNFIFFIVAYTISFYTIHSQETETCDSPKESLFDLSTITKCSLKDDETDEASSIVSRKSKRITIQVRKRVVRKGVTLTGNNTVSQVKKNVQLVNALTLSNAVVDKVPFDLVEEKPLFENCKNEPVKKQPDCFKESIMKHIKEHFMYPPEAHRKSIQGRVLAQFVIDESGNVSDVNVRGPYRGELLEEEAERIIRKLPKFTPGKLSSKIVKVKYGVPITFRIPGKKPSNVRKVKAKINPSDIVFFSKVNKIPLFRKCKNVVDNEQLDCFNTQMIAHVQKYFEYPQMAAEMGIEGKVYVYFVIDKDGDVVNIKSKGPNGGEILNKMGEMVVSKLPQFIPGMQNGKAANVKYVIPIEFKLN